MSIVSLLPKAGARSSAGSQPNHRFRLSRVFLGGICVLALTAGAYSAWAWSLGRSRNVWLVNGLDRAYDVRISGKVFHLMPHDARQVQVAEGDLTVVSADEAVPFSDQTCRVSTPFLKRPFVKPTFVINPDRTALVYEEEALFSQAAPKSLEEMDHHKLYVGEAVYAFSQVDYPFDEFPDKVSAADGGADVLKKKVALWTIGTMDQKCRLLRRELGNTAAATYAENLAVCNPENQTVLMHLAVLMPKEQVIAFLRSRLDVRPVQVIWHKTYQQLCEQLEPSHDLAAEYRTKVGAEPDNSSLMYLLARVAPDRAESMHWLKKSTQCAYPSGYGFFALAYRALSKGDFETALIAAQEAATLLPDNRDARAVEAEALAATGHFDRLLVLAREAQSKTPMDPRPVMQEIQLLAIRKDVDQARRARDAFVSRTSAPERAAMLRQFEVASEAVIEYADGNLPQYLATLERGAITLEQRFEYDLSQDRLDEAAADLSTNLQAMAGAHLTLAVAALDSGRDDLASRHLRLAAAGYAKGDNDMRRVAQWLSQSNLPDPDEVCDVALMPDQKKLVLTALGLRDSEHRDRYFKAAAELNYDRAFPYLTVKRVLEAPVLAMK